MRSASQSREFSHGSKVTPMKDRKNRDLRDLCAHVFDDDRADRVSGRSLHEARDDRKTLQLCKQVRQALETLLAQSHWAIEARVHVHAVQPSPDASTLQVTLVSPHPDRVRVHAIAALPAMRAAATHAIARKRAPMLTLLILPEISR